MKQVSILILVFISISNYAQDLTCKDFKEGVFIDVNEENGLTLKIVRSENTQKEQIVDSQQDIKSAIPEDTYFIDIEWLDDCSYRLYHKSNNGKPLPDTSEFINRNGGIIVEIVKIKGNCFYYTSSLNVDGEEIVINNKMCKVAQIDN